MVLLFRAGCVLAILCLVTAQTDEDLAHLISEIYPESGDNTTTKDTPSTGGENSGIIFVEELVGGDGNCTCVPYYLCRTKSIEKQCQNLFDVCCTSGDNVDSEPITGPVIDIK